MNIHSSYSFKAKYINAVTLFTSYPFIPLIMRCYSKVKQCDPRSPDVQEIWDPPHIHTLVSILLLGLK